MAEGEGDEFGFVLHVVASGEDISTETESQALTRTRLFRDGQDWSLWKVRKDGTGQPTMVAVGAGPVAGG